MARLLGAPPHGLDGVHHVLLVIHVGVAERRRPRQVPVHVREHSRELRERLDARVPRLRVDLPGQLLRVRTAVLLHPAIGLDDLLGIGGGGQDLRDQLVGVDGDRRDELLQLLRRRLRETHVGRRDGLVRRVGGGARRRRGRHERDEQQQCKSRRRATASQWGHAGERTQASCRHGFVARRHGPGDLRRRAMCRLTAERQHVETSAAWLAVARHRGIAR